MDLGDLKESLRQSAARTQPPRTPPAAAAAAAAGGGAAAAAAAAEAAGGLAADIFAKHRHSSQPESRALCAALGAVLEVVAGEGLRPTPTALFAALMAALERPETRADAAAAAAACHLLDSVLGRLPPAVLRARWAGAARVLGAALEAQAADAAAAKWAVSCLCQVLAAADGGDWPSAAGPFAAVLAACLDARPKVRKRAHAGLAAALAALAGTPAAAPAGDAVARLARSVLPAPEAAARAAASAPGKRRAAAEEAIKAAVGDALHLLGALRGAAPALAPPAAAAVAEAAAKLFALRQPLLSCHAADLLTALAGAPRGGGGGLPPAALAGALTAAAAGGLPPPGERGDAVATLAAIRFLEVGCARLHVADAAAGATALPAAVVALAGQLGAEQDEVRAAAAAALAALAGACVDAAEVAAALAAARAPLGRGAAPPLARVLAAVEAALGPRELAAWPGALAAAAALFRALGRPGAPLAEGLVARVGDLCAGADDAAEEAEAMDDGEGGGAAAAAAARAAAAAAQDALGAGLRALGPEAVLAVLPLGLAEGLDGRGEARTWLLPLLRAHVRGVRLGYWRAELLPLARALGARAEAAARDPARGREAAAAAALAAQVWGCLPAFASWAEDAGGALRALSPALAEAFTSAGRRGGAPFAARAAVCATLRRVATQARAAAAAAGEPPVGHADPLAAPDDDADGRKDAVRAAAAGAGTAGADAGGDAEVPPRLAEDPAWARATLAALRELSPSWLPALLDASLAAPPGPARAPLAAAASALACAADPAVVARIFRAGVGRAARLAAEAGAAAAAGGADDSLAERRAALADALLALAGGLDAAGAAALYAAAAAPGLAAPDPAAQKRAYRTLAYLCEHRGADFLAPHFQEVLAALLAAGGAAASAARRHRLRCLRVVLGALVDPDGPEFDLGALAPALPGAADDAGAAAPGAPRAARAAHVVAALASEVVLALKEANARTRAAAYELLVAVAHEMHEADPPRGGDGLEGEDGEGEDGAGPPGGGGLHTLLTIVLGGLVGSTPHMVSASVQALARLLFEFAPALAGVAPRLVPAVLLLFRSRAREVVKSAIGFCKVAAVRLPVEQLRAHAPAMLEGLLLWAEDSKNKFKLRVRVVVERLCRRLGFDEVAAHIPPAHAKLATHIRKQAARKERRRAGGSEHGGGAGDARSRGARSRGGRSEAGAATRWAEAAAFSDDSGSDGGGGRRGARTTATTAAGGARRAATAAPTARTGRTARTAPGGGGGGVLAGGAGGDPVDLLDRGTARRMARAAAGFAGGAGGGAPGGAAPAPPRDAFGTDARGRLVIRDDDAGGGRGGGGKRGRADGDDAGFDSSDSDYEDLRGITGKRLALAGSKSAAAAPGIAASLAGRSLAGRTAGGRSAGGRSARSEGRRPGATPRGAQHSGERFRAKKGGAGGDVSAPGGVEPYAYWPLDRKALNRRAGKRRGAEAGLAKVVGAAREGAARGRKAKRARR